MPNPSRIFSPAAPPPLPVSVDSDIIVIVAALLCALICIVGLGIVGRCAWIRRSLGERAPQVPADKGLKKKVLRSLPKASFSGAGDGTLKECPVCLAEFADGDQIRALPQCGHVFHVTCVDPWLASHSSCPFCRRILEVARCQECGELQQTRGKVKVCVGPANDGLEP